MANDDQQDNNPFAPPSAHVADVRANAGDFELATRGSRLAAVVLDALCFAVPGLVVIPFSSIDAITTFRSSAMWAIAFLGIIFVALVVVNIYLLATRSQTIGKRIMRIRIVRTDGARAGFWRIFGLRILVNTMIANIPIIGTLYALVDILCIFRESHKCLHDNLADTIVVKA